MWQSSATLTMAAGFGLTWMVQSSSLLVLGLLGGRIVRRSGPAVQSGIYRATLAAVLACPIVSALLGAAGVNGLSFGVSAADSVSIVPSARPQFSTAGDLGTLSLARSAAPVAPPSGFGVGYYLKDRPIRLTAGDLPITGRLDQKKLPTYGQIWADNFHALKEVDAAPGADETRCDLTLDPGSSVTVRMLDPEGKPLSDLVVDGRFPQGVDAGDMGFYESNVTRIAGLEPDETRSVVFKHDDRKLGAWSRLAILRVVFDLSSDTQTPSLIETALDRRLP
jgi:hypothetical protein